MEVASFLIVYLGYLINSRRMVMSWPVEKRMQLAELLDGIFMRDPCMVTPRESSSLLGLIQNADLVAPLGIYLLLWVQYDLSDSIKSVWSNRGARPPLWWKRWYRRSQLRSSHHTLQDLCVL